MGFKPKDTDTIEQRFGFLKLNSTYRPGLTSACTAKYYLLLISVWMVCLLALKSRFFASGFKNQESRIGLSNNLWTPGDRFLHIEDIKEWKPLYVLFKLHSNSQGAVWVVCSCIDSLKLSWTPAAFLTDWDCIDSLKLSGQTTTVFIFSYCLNVR